MRMERKSNMGAQVEKHEKDKEEKAKKAVDLSGRSMDSLPNFPAHSLAFIVKLDLSNNNLESIPESLTARLLNVEVLDVHSNQLQALPNSIGCLSKLKVLNASGNYLQSLPKTIENCRALEELIANFNELTSLPDTMGFELTNIRNISVNSNKLAFLPSSTSHMTSLISLDARLNNLGSLPEGLENLTRLRSLDVSQNFHHLTSLPYSIGLLLSLTDLDVSYNTLTVLPDSISCLTKLRNFNAEGNPLVRPPLLIVQHGLVPIQEYLRARMNGTVLKGSRRSWIGKLVKCGTFSGRTIPRENQFDDSEEFLSAEFPVILGVEFNAEACRHVLASASLLAAEVCTIVTDEVEIWGLVLSPVISDVWLVNRDVTTFPCIYLELYLWFRMSKSRTQQRNYDNL